MERCPLCKARLRDQAICNRCNADLGLLQVIKAQAERCAQRAIRNLLAGEMAAARSEAVAACDLHATAFHRALTGFITTMDGVDLLHRAD